MAEYNVELTEKASEFCRLIVFERESQYRAHMRAFGTTKATAPAEASKLMKRENIKAEIARLRDMKSQDAEWTFDDSVQELKGVIMNPENQTVKVNALKEINRMFGWDKRVVDHTSSDGSMTPKPTIDPSKLSTETLEELLNARVESD